MSQEKDILDHFDDLTSNVGAAKAILDAAKVLTALRSARADAQEGCGATGEGWANGFTLRDDTLPTMLAHAVGLLDTVSVKVDLISEAALRPKPVSIAM